MWQASGRWQSSPTYEEALACASCSAPTAAGSWRRRKFRRWCRYRPAALSQEALSLRYKESAGLTVQVEPEDAADPSVVWSSSDPSVGHGGRQRHSAGRGAGTGGDYLFLGGRFRVLLLRRSPWDIP